MNRTSAAHRAASVVAALAGSLFLLFLLAPLARLITAGAATGAGQLFTDAELRGSLVLTALTATAAAALGVPHPVAGIALLLVLGRQSALGGALLAAGLRVVGSPLGIIAAMLFVSAPLFVSAAREAFSRVDVRYESVARTLGDAPWTVFRRVTLPLAMRGLVAAGVVMWTRAVSEFGAIVILTYNPKVASVLSYDRFTSFGLSEALPVAAILALLALVPLVALRALRPERGPVDA